MAEATLSFWLTNSPIKDSLYPTASQLLVSIYKIFKDVYIEQCRNYLTFLSEALTKTANFPVNENNIEEVISHLTSIFRRIYVILTRHRKSVIETFTRMSSFDTEAAQNFIDSIEIRRKSDSQSSRYPDIKAYERMATCANSLGLFTYPITAQDIINIRDGIETPPLKTNNIAQATFFFGALAFQKLLPKQWKSNIVNLKLLVSERTGSVPTAKYLRNIASQLDITTVMETMAYNPLSKFYKLSRYEIIAMSIIKARNYSPIGKHAQRRT